MAIRQLTQEDITRRYAERFEEWQRTGADHGPEHHEWTGLEFAIGVIMVVGLDLAIGYGVYRFGCWLWRML